MGDGGDLLTALQLISLNILKTFGMVAFAWLWRGLLCDPCSVFGFCGSTPDHCLLSNNCQPGVCFRIVAAVPSADCVVLLSMARAGCFRVLPQQIMNVCSPKSTHRLLLP
jgi:hypothetical protein